MAEQTLTINTLAATVITPSDVSQFSLDDIAPNIINGGGGTIVDVSGIVALASQVAELDSDVTVLEANVATVQADVTALQEDVSGLDATVAQVQTTATAAAETANAASGTASDALEVATQAQTTATTAETRAQLAQSTAAQAGGAATNAVKMANEAKTAATAASETAQYALNADFATRADTVNTAQYALNAGTAKIAYTISNPDPGLSAGPYGVSTTATRTDNIYKIRLGNTTDLVYVAHAETAQYALQVQSAASATSLNYTNNFNQVGQLQATVTWADKSLQFNDGNGVNLVAATAAYALAVAGDSSGGGFDGSYTGNTVELNACSSILLGAQSWGTSLNLTGDGASLIGPHVTVAGDGDTRIGASSSNIIFGGATTYFNMSATDIMVDGTGSPTSLKDTILMYAGSGGSSSDDYPPLTQRSGLYYGIVNDTLSLRFGSFGNADGSQAEAVLKVYEDDIYVTSRGDYIDSKQTYGLAVTPPTIRVGTWAGDAPSMYKGMCIPDGADLASFMSVGSFIDGTYSYVWGLMADSTTAAFGKVDRSAALGSSINLEAGIKVSEQYVLLANNYNVSGQKSSLEMDASGTTLSAMFTLNNGETTIAPTDWVKLKQLADRASDILALLSN